MTNNKSQMISIDEARQYYGNSDAVHDFDHVLRVLALAERIGRAEGADIEIVRAAALLHDVGRAHADAQGLDHAAVGAEMTRAILAGQPPTKVEAVAHAVAAHRFRADSAPETLEAQVLFDADKLDAIGAVGIARAFAYGGAHGQRLWAPRESVDVARWKRAGDDPDAHTPVHEFVVKLSQLKDRLFTPTGHAIAAERHAFMVDFFARMDAEVQGEL
jgi:uncharacterized protein